MRFKKASLSFIYQMIVKQFVTRRCLHYTAAEQNEFFQES